MPAWKDLLGCRPWRRGVVVAGVVAGRFAVTDVGAGVMGDSGDHVTDDACNNAPSLAPQAECTEARDVCVLAILRCARVSGLAGVTRPGVWDAPAGRGTAAGVVAGRCAVTDVDAGELALAPVPPPPPPPPARARARASPRPCRRWRWFLIMPCMLVCLRARPWCRLARLLLMCRHTPLALAAGWIRCRVIECSTLLAPVPAAMNVTANSYMYNCIDV